MNAVEFLCRVVSPGPIASGDGWAIFTHRPNLAEEMGYARYNGQPTPDGVEVEYAYETWRTRGTQSREASPGAVGAASRRVLVALPDVPDPVYPSRDGYPGKMRFGGRMTLPVRREEA